LHARPDTGGLVHHSARGTQYLSTRYNERLADSIIGHYNTEVIRCRGPWRPIEAVERATLDGADGFNNRRLLEPIGNVPPAEFEQTYYRSQENHATVA